MIPYNPKKDLEDNYYNKTEVELLVAGGSGGSIDLSNYYKKLETYSKAQVDSLVAGGGADLSDYYTKAEVESLISAIPATDLTNYYNKTEVNSLIPDISTKQDNLVSGTNIKTINGQSVLGSGNIEITGGGSGGNVDLSDYYKKTETYSKVEVDTKIDDIPTTDLSGYYNKAQVDGLLDSISLDDYYTKTQTEVLLSNKVEKEDGKGLSTNDFTNTFKQAYDGHLASTSNPHNVTALQVGAYSKSENDNLLAKKANLDLNNKIPLSEIPDSILGQLKYMGVWDFSSGFPTGAEKGNYWITSETGNGYEVGDWAVYNGTSFDKIDNTDAVSSVAGRTGNVVLNKNDVGLNNVDNTSDLNKPISTATQTALDTKQEILVSGTSVKTINGQSILGNGNIEITTETDLTDYYTKSETDSLVGDKGDTGEKGDKGDKGDTGEKGDKGDDGNGIVSVVRTSGTGAPGTTDTFTITFTDTTTSTFNVYNGQDGIGAINDTTITTTTLWSSKKINEEIAKAKPSTAFLMAYSN